MHPCSEKISVSGDAYGANEPIFCYYKIALIHLLLVSATCSRTLAAAAPVVGWPPVRSFRRNLASSSASKRPPADPRNGADDKAGYKGLFVKVNMDGVPIGRKVDLKAQGDYGNLSVAVDRLFRDLLAGTHAPSGRSYELDYVESLEAELDMSSVCVCRSSTGSEVLRGGEPAVDHRTAGRQR
jgi:auxin-responsive protein IAA